MASAAPSAADHRLSQEAVSSMSVALTRASYHRDLYLMASKLAAVDRPYETRPYH